MSETTEMALVSTDMTIVSTERKRKQVVPPKKVTAEMSLFDYLRKCSPPLDQKIIDIACSQTQVPMELRKDAGQEIIIVWAQTKPDCREFKPGQVASYAHRMARHVALRVRRDMGSPVRLPGSAFRKRKDGSSYVTPGALAAPLSWNELETWFQTDDLTDGPNGAASLMAAGGADSDDFSAAVMSLEDAANVAVAVDEDAETRKERSDALRTCQDKITPRQARIMELLIDGESFDDIMTTLNIKKGVLMREIAIASSLIGPSE